MSAGMAYARERGSTRARIGSLVAMLRLAPRALGEQSGWLDQQHQDHRRVDEERRGAGRQHDAEGADLAHEKARHGGAAEAAEAADDDDDDALDQQVYAHL